MGADHPQRVQRSLVERLADLRAAANRHADLRATIADLERWRDVRKRKRLDVRVMNRALTHLRRQQITLEAEMDRMAKDPLAVAEAGLRGTRMALERKALTPERRERLLAIEAHLARRVTELREQVAHWAKLRAAYGGSR